MAGQGRGMRQSMSGIVYYGWHERVERSDSTLLIII